MTDPLTDLDEVLPGALGEVRLAAGALLVADDVFYYEGLLEDNAAVYFFLDCY